MKKFSNSVLLLIAISGLLMIASAASVFVLDIKLVTAVLVATAVVPLAILCWMMAQADTMTNRMLGLLKKKDTLYDKTIDRSYAGPMQKAIREYCEEYSQRCESAESKNRDLLLQIQLLNRRKSSIEEILYSITDAVVVTDEYNRLILANPAAEQLFSFKYNPENPKSIDELIGEIDLTELVKKTGDSKVRHVKHELTFERNCLSATYDAILSCMKDAQDGVLGVVSVLHDITREKEIAQMKNDFVSHVSHELKTPLASINAYAEMLVDGEAEDTETIQQFCSIIQSQAQRLNRLIEDILNISRIESGLIKVAKENHSLAMIVHDAGEMIASYAQEKDITVHTPAPILFDQVYVDRDMISQVVINLLSNAVKYTRPGGEVTIKSEVNDVDQIVTVTVTDTGVGIPAEDVDHVFDKFYRVEANNKYAKGTGLGLNLVKQIVETVHEGRVFVTSVQGQGSTFGFELPLASVEVALAK